MVKEARKTRTSKQSTPRKSGKRAKAGRYPISPVDIEQVAVDIDRALKKIRPMLIVVEQNTTKPKEVMAIERQLDKLTKQPAWLRKFVRDAEALS